MSYRLKSIFHKLVISHTFGSQYLLKISAPRKILNERTNGISVEIYNKNNWKTNSSCLRIKKLVVYLRLQIA